MNTPDYSRAASKAARILEECLINEPPILPEDIADLYNININLVIFPTGLKNISGFFDFKENKIFVNSEDPYNRRTFTIAHELGHFFLHSKLFKDNPEKYAVLMRHPIAATYDPVEIEANIFAANLLVPQNLLDKYVKYASEHELSNIFAVSKEVIRNRCKTLKIDINS